jgi:HD-GYP domain-containing protein (c-di-GMP phosphodiesterase class II)
MLKKINVNSLRIGQYVILPAAWYEHGFLKNSFRISSENQLAKLKKTGFTEITIDTEKGADSEEGKDSRPPSIRNSKTEAAKTVKTEALKEVIRDKKLPAFNKAEAVHKESMVVMSSLLENPSAKNIEETKKGIAEMVDLILADDATTHHLLRITNHDHYTYTHSVTVGVLSVTISKVLFKGTLGHDMHALGAGFFLHDLGKVKIDKEIINKPAKLTDEEMSQMRRHPAIGFNILNDTKQLTDESKLIVLQHHERNDGKGYPKGLRGNDIHIYGRICSVADVYDALTSVRPYRQPMAPFDALKLMKEEMIGHFQQELFEHLVLLLK